MKKTLPYFVILLMMFLVTACGTSTSPANQTPVSTVVITGPQPQSGATQGVPQTGKTNQVTITLADNTITPSTTNFQVGVPYTFVITNTGHHAHNFNINTPVSIAGSLDNALNGALLAIPQDQLAPGQSMTAVFTFPTSSAGKPLEFSCLIRSHYESGMHVNINVVK